MAETKDENAARDSSQPTVAAQKPDTTKASPEGARAAVMASAQPTVDVVAMVSRDKNGNPAQSDNFIVLVPEGASDEVRDAHWNRAGEAQGAKHLSSEGGERDPGSLGWGGFTDEEIQERAETERRELHRHNFREELKA
jgi:hypothetical protein